MSNPPPSDTVTTVTLSAGKQPATWWASGLCLSERLPSATRSTRRASSRLARWRAAHDGDEEQFAIRLAEVGLDQAGLDTLLSETPQELAARTGRPAWAAFVERATTTAAHAKYTPADDSWQESFAFTLRPLLAASAALDPRLGDDFVRQLAKLLVRIASRTLVLELNVARVRGTLTGDTPRERFADFTANLRAADLLADYPVLARLLGQACLHAVDAHVELLDRFAADRAEIVRTLLGGVDPGPVVSIEAGQGDAHRRGRSVATLRFADGRRVAYKPRSVALHAHFNELLTWFDGHADLGLRQVAVVAGEDYGWLEFAEQRPCADATEVGRFYRRLGALLALLYAVDGTDMHHENLIACGDQPLLIDIETLFHPTMIVATPDTDPAAVAMIRSVHRTALLPHILLGEHGAFDLSGLGGDDGGTYPSDVVVWLDAGTDRMRLTRKPMPVAGARNRPRIGEQDVEPADYTAALLAGFRIGYDAISAHRGELLGPTGLLQRCADDEVRFIPRVTRLYSKVLDESTHPDALRDALDRDLALDLLWTESGDDAVLRALVPHELADLWEGDVPLFTTRAGSRDVWTAGGRLLPGLLPSSGLAAAERKIERMGEVDRHDQQWLITAALASRPGPVEHRGGDVLPGPVAAGVPDPQQLLMAACGIADEILAHAAMSGNRVNWLGLELVDDRHWAVMPMGAGLSNGYTGVALFLAQLGKLTGASRYTDVARDALRPIPALLDFFATDPDLAAAVGSGGFHGMGGISYALARLTSLLPDDPDLLRWLAMSVEASAGIVDESPNVVEGSAGGLAAMLAVRAETGLPLAGEMARRLADRLVDATIGGHGFARGSAGAGWALLRFAAAGGGQRYAVAGRAALRADHGLRQRLLDIREADHSWCSGLSGAVLAHVGHPDQPIDSFTLHLDRCLNALAVHEPLRDLSLCHGELGVIESLTVLAERGHEFAAATRIRRAGLVLGALDQYGARCGTPGGVPSAGLLTGLSGIGYGLLRLGFPEQVPSVLLLDPC
jgi:type 2 lantibiotic biosynthesis protein LanM